MGPLSDFNRQRRGVAVYGSTFAPPRPQPMRPVPAPAGGGGGSFFDQLQASAPRMEAAPKEEDEDGNVFGRGLGYLVNNPVTQNALKPLEILDIPRRGVLSTINELIVDPLTGDESSFGDWWDQVNRADFGVGEMVGDVTDNKWVNRAIGLTGDVLLDPLTYVGGIGFAGKAGAAGGRSARILNAGKAMAEAKQAGRWTDDLARELEDVVRYGYHKAAPETLESMGVRGGIRMTTNPISPYRGKQFTIPGSEKLTEPLSAVRRTVGDKVGSTKVGRKVMDIRTPEGLEKTYDRLFYGEGSESFEAALTRARMHQKTRRHQGFLAPIQRQADRLTHETRNLPQDEAYKIIEELEGTGALKEGSIAARIRNLLDQSWKKVTDDDMPLAYRQRYSPHIISREGMEWRKAQSGNVKAPTGFFTERVYDPSGVTMGRKLEIGDEFEINGNTFKIEKGTVKEFNEKARQAGLDFDFFETDPGIVLQKYLNMLSQDYATWKVAPDVIEDLGNQGMIRDPLRGPERDGEQGLPVLGTGTSRFRQGGTELAEDDADWLLREQLGVGPDVDISPYKVSVDKTGTAQVNRGINKRLKMENAAARETLGELRRDLRIWMREMAGGKMKWPGAPSLREEADAAVARAKRLGEEMDARTLEFNYVKGQSDQALNEFLTSKELVEMAEEELAALELAIEAAEASAVKEKVAGLRAQRRVLRDKLNSLGERQTTLRRKIEKAGEDFDLMIAARRNELYTEAGLPTPYVPPGAPRPAQDFMGTGPAPVTKSMGQQEAILFNDVAARVKDGRGYKRKLNELAKLSGRTAEDLKSEIDRRLGQAAARPTAPTRPRVSKVPSRNKIIQTLEELRRPTLGADFQRMADLSEGRVVYGKNGRPRVTGQTMVPRMAKAEVGNIRSSKVYERLRREGWLGNAKTGKGFEPDVWAAQYESISGKTFPDVEAAIDDYFSMIEDMWDRTSPSRVPDHLMMEAANELGVHPELVRFAVESGDATTETIGEQAARGFNQALQQFKEGLDELGPEIAGPLREEMRNVTDGEDAFGLLNAISNDTDLWLNMGDTDMVNLARWLGSQTDEATAPAAGAVSPRRRAAQMEEANRVRDELDSLSESLRSAGPDGRLTQRIEETVRKRDQYRGAFAVDDDELLAAQLEQVRQIYADSMSDAAKRKDEEALERMREEVKRFASVRTFRQKLNKMQDTIDRLDAERARILDRAPRLMEERQAQLRPLMEQLAETRPPRPEPRPPRPGTEAIDAEARLRRIPTEGQKRLPNVKPTKPEGDWTKLAEHKMVPALQQGTPEFDAAAKAFDEAKKKLAGARRLVKDRMRKVENHPDVTAAYADRQQSSMSGLVTPGKINVPKRPGEYKRAGQYAKRGVFDDLPPEVQEWSKRVDRIVEQYPIKGSVGPGRQPSAPKARAKYDEVVKRVSKEVGLDEARQLEEQAIRDLSQANYDLNRMVYTGENPADLQRLSKEIRGAYDPGEYQTLADLRNRRGEEIASTQRRAGEELAEVEEAIPAARAEVEDVGEQLAEITRNPEAREAIRRDATEGWRESKSNVERSRLLLSDARDKADKRFVRAEEELIELDATLADIQAQHVDASKEAGKAKGKLARVAKIDPKNRGDMQVEEWLEHVNKTDPGLADMDNQAITYAMAQAEEMAEKIKPVLAEVERTGVSKRHEYAGRVLTTALDDTTWSYYAPELFGPNGPIIHNELRRMLENVRQVAPEPRFWKYIDNLTGLFKTYAVLTPGFHVRNSMSAGFNNAADGVGLGDMGKSVAVMRRYGKAVQQGEEAVQNFLIRSGNEVLNSETGLTLADALDAVAGTGVGGRYREHGIADRSLARWKFNERLYENSATYWLGKKPGTFVESAVRLPVALDTLRRGGTVEDAVQRITRLHFDYSEVSRFDKAARRLIPFWTFMSRNMPLQVSMMWTQPRAYAKYNSLVRNLRGPSEEGEPDYFKSIGAFRLADTKLAGLPLYLQPDLAHTRIEEDVARYSNIGNPANMLSDLNPLFSAPMEYAFGKDAFTGRTYDETDMRVASTVEKPIEWLGRAMGVTETTPGGQTATPEKLFNALRAVIPIYDRSARLAPGVVTGDQDSNSRQLESMLRFAGAPIRQLSPQQQLATLRSEYFEARDDRDLLRALARLDQ